MIEYKGQRVAELLASIAELEKVLDHTVGAVVDLGGQVDVLAMVEGYATLAIAKAKLSSLKGTIS